MRRETARRFAERGAKLVMAARSQPGLASPVGEIAACGGEGGSAMCHVVEGAADDLARFLRQG